jgi:hypothetical protein
MAMTYTISGEGNGLDFSQLRKILKDVSNYTFIEKPVSEKVHISFGTFGNFIIHGKLHKNWDYDPAFFKQKTVIKNTLGNSNHLINKSQLYDTIKKLIPNGIKYLPKNYATEEIEKILASSNTDFFPLILKKNNSEKQKGVIIINSKEEYYNAKEKLHKLELERAKIKKVKPSYDMMISKYITNSLLIKEKKFHLRVYFLLSVISGITCCTVIHNKYLILTAKLPYIASDYLNDEIHLTGFHNTDKLYNYPEDLQKEYPDHFITIENNLNKCNKVIAMALSIANIQHYSESYAGYHIYGLDIMITDDYHPYLLEINSKPGFNTNSHDIFSFILNHTVFPLFGIKRPPIYDAEFIGNGALTPFAGVITGDNKCILIPYLDATSEEIDKVKQIHFFNNGIINKCLPINIFLIASFSFFLKRKETKKNLSDNIKNLSNESKDNLSNNIIGFLVLDVNNYLQVAIIEEFQNRGIATAMIAQFLEIHYARNFIHNTNKIYINKSNMFMIAIAKKLHFVKNKNNHYEYDYSTKLTLKKNINTNSKITYKIIYENIDDHINFDIDKYMTKSNSQFVSFVYNLLNNISIIKHSTGNKYSKNFIYQGAELKSTLDIKILFGLFLVKLWSYKHDIKTSSNIFDKRIENKEQLILESQTQQRYTIYDTNMQNYMLLNGNEIKEEYYDINNYFIEEYNPPYLLDGKLMYIIYYVIIHITKNGIIKCYIFSKNNIATPKNKYTEDLNNADEIVPKYINTLKKYDINSISDVCTSYENLYPIIISFLELLVKYEIKPYPESNSGFLEFPILIKYIKKSGKYEPVIGKIDNNTSIKNNNIIDSDFVDEYYKWVRNCVILPHFGMISHKNRIMPNYGALSKYVQYNSKIQYSIIEKTHLEFISSTEIIAYYDMKLIGNIKLHIISDYIYVKNMPHIILSNDITIDNNSIEINVIFMLMELLRASYAPIQMFLLLKYEKKMNDIAFELEFSKKDKDDYYIKKC